MSMNPFIAQLADLCAGSERSESKTATWLFVPTHAVGLTLGDRLARDARNWANLRSVTPLDIAIRMAAPFLVEQGIEPSEEQLGPALMMRLLLAQPEVRGYFRPMAEHTSMAEALWHTVRELRYAAVTSADLAAVAFTPVASKRDELVALLAAYERHLETARVADMPAVLHEAMRHPDWCPIRGGDNFIELPDTVWSPLVRRFLDWLPGVRIPRPSSPSSPSPPCSIFHAGGRDAEVDEVFRRIVASGVPLDQVEVVCASSAYPMLVAEKAALLEWRATVSDGMPASATRPGRLLLRFCDWVAGGFVAADLRRLLQSGDCAPQTFDQGAAPLSAAQAARLLLKSQATWGRHVYTPALTRLVQRYDRRAADTEASEEIRAWNTGKATAVRTLIEWIEEILDSVPREDSAIGDEPRRNETGAGVPLAALVDSATAFVARNAGRASALDAIASVRLTDALAELHTLGDYRCEISAAVRFIRERVESLVVGRDRPRPGHLHISSLAAAGFDGRRLVFIVGLQEGGVFPSPVEDAVLLDDERAKISAMLRTSLERQDQVVSMALSRLAAIRHSSEQLCLSFSSRDTREFRDTFPSWIVLQAFRRISGNPASSYDDLSKWLGEPVSAVPASPGAGVTEGQWWLAQAKSNRHAKAAILETYPALASGIEAEAARDSDLFTKFDGYVPEAGAALDPGRTGRAISATSLESAAKCPLRFFFQRGLGISVIEEGRVDEDGWLDPLLRGSELHDLFAAIMRVVRHEKRKPDPNADKARLREMGTKRLEELRDAMPPPSDEVFARQSAEFLDDLDAFIEAECAGKHGGAPVGFEVSFGFALDEDEADGPREPLASEEPALIELGDGRRIVLHGRIDRINRIEPAKYEVVDYKTGGYWPNDWKGEFAGGTRLQHALYGVAATALLKKRDPKAQVVRGVYLFPAVKGRGHRKVIPAPSRARLVAVLRDLTDVIGKGAFAAADGPDGCKWCDFKAACHAEAGERSQAKVENPANAMLQPYRDLRGNHE